MKTLRMIGLALVAVLLSVGLAACSSDDDDDSDGGSSTIVGTWKIVNISYPDYMQELVEMGYVEQDANVGDIETFNADGTYENAYERGKWKLTGKKLKLYDVKPFDGSVAVDVTVDCNISGNSMTMYMEMMECTIKYTRVN